MKKIEEYVSGIYKDFEKSFNDTHDMPGHVDLVLKNAENIAKGEGADVSICKAAVLLHDIGQVQGHKDHEKRSAEMAIMFLKGIGVDENTVSRIVHCIEAHSSGWTKERSLEAKVVSEADKLECLGSWGFVRVFENRLKQDKSINEALSTAEKVTESAYGRMDTGTAKKLAKPLYESNREFFRLLKKQRGF